MFPILPGMDFSWVDPEGTPNRRWRAVMSKEVWQQVVNIRLYGDQFRRRRGTQRARAT